MMPQIDPKFTFWFGVWTNVLLLIASLGVDQAPHVVAQYAPTVQWFCMALYKINNAVLTGLVGLSSTQAGPLIKVPSGLTIVKILILAFAVSLLVEPGSAQAQSRRGLAFTGDLQRDIKTDLNNSGIKVPTVKPGQACDFNIFAALKPENVVTTIQNCVSDASKPFEPDVQAALDSATKANDKPAIDCLTPALAIVQAAVGTPAVKAADGTITTPAVMPGIILIFQKFREFTLANGPSACKNWVQSTINGTLSNAL
jgi:hypothetical protein